MINIKNIGIVSSKFKEAEPSDARLMKKEISYVKVKEEFAEGLYKIEKSEFIDIVFHFHQSENYEMKTHTYSGDYKGVFATRSPKRPSAIGVTTVKLLERKGNTLKVTGLDAIDGTPVLDIKTGDTYLLQQNLEDINNERLKNDPRKDIMALILAKDTERLLLKAGQLHGHYCPGLAMGVMAATHAMNELKVNDSDGLEDLLAITETNNCLSDGVQFVTGCTFGNNALIFKDLGKTAFTLTKRDGKGIRIASRADAKEYMHKEKQAFTEEYARLVGEQDHSKERKENYKLNGIQAALHTLKLDFDKIFKVERIDVEIPEYAPSHESIICTKCSEPIMATRIVEKNKKPFCLECVGEAFGKLDGQGVHNN
ncbi:MAG: tRNA (N6-threonylcarbamoyladenosine(37)-N6)-methyltransferase TrmO [Bacteroidales bacterium]|nr:tRNA (N6-threonylcarbamoyladenosine(37)-N6)-methyltransferase TrmO [Bacteroidales bacterium]MCF8399243.1 tRNA (N6-threonylcarbamoyladenosine(37)-N6)-methyltransferase TrmO [Bacteroidales bacterium]